MADGREYDEYTEQRVRCIIRLRPFTKPDAEGIISVDGEKRLLIRERFKNSGTAKGSKEGTYQERTTEYTFDRCFAGVCKQAEVFLDTGLPLVEHALLGSNACCFAYGQTGSGKTYSMFGAEGGDWENRGLIPRSVEYMLERAAHIERSTGRKFTVTVSFLEIYMEKIRDLGRGAAGVLSRAKLSAEVMGMTEMPMPGSLRTEKSLKPIQRRKSVKEAGGTALASQTSMAPTEYGDGRTEAGDSVAGGGGGATYDPDNLDILESKEGDTYVQGLCHLEVTSVSDVMNVLTAGYALRRTDATLMNAVSSRSHTVFTLTVRSAMPDGSAPMVGRLNLCDLAGSERVKKSGSEGMRFKEAIHINQSLTSLAKVILALATGDLSAHVPYRDSKLTRILKDSLAGNSYTTVLANVNPSRENHDESVLTLSFAQRCSTLVMKPKVNTATTEETADLDTMAEYEEEVVTLGKDAEGRAVSTYQAVPKGMEVNRRMVSNAEATLGLGPGTGKGSTAIKGLTGSEMVKAQAAATASVAAATAGTRPVSAMKNTSAGAGAGATGGGGADRGGKGGGNENEGGQGGGSGNVTPGGGKSRMPLDSNEAQANLIRAPGAVPERDDIFGAPAGGEEEEAREPKFMDESVVRRVKIQGTSSRDGSVRQNSGRAAAPGSVPATPATPAAAAGLVTAASLAATPVSPLARAPTLAPTMSMFSPYGGGMSAAERQQLEVLQYDLRREKDRVVALQRNVTELQMELSKAEQTLNELRDTKSREDVSHGQQVRGWRDRVNRLEEQIRIMRNATKADEEVRWRQVSAENARLLDEVARMKTQLGEVTRTAQNLAEKRDFSEMDGKDRERRLKENFEGKLADTIRSLEAQRQAELSAQKEQFQRYMDRKDAELVAMKRESEKKIRDQESSAAEARRLAEHMTSLVTHLEDTLARMGTLNLGGGALDRRHLQALLSLINRKIDLQKTETRNEVSDIVFQKITGLQGIRQAIDDAERKLHAIRVRPDPPGGAAGDGAPHPSDNAVFTVTGVSTAAGGSGGRPPTAPAGGAGDAESAMLLRRPRAELVSDIERYRRELQVERKRSQDLMVALRSAQRMSDRQSDSPAGAPHGQTPRSRPGTAGGAGAAALQTFGPGAGHGYGYMSRPASAISATAPGRPRAPGPPSPFSSLLLTTRGAVGAGVGPGGEDSPAALSQTAGGGRAGGPGGGRGSIPSGPGVAEAQGVNALLRRPQTAR